MSSAFDAKFESLMDTVLEKLPVSVMNTPWKRTLFWIVYGTLALAMILLFALFGLLLGLLKAVFDPDKSASRPFSNEDDNGKTQAEKSTKALMDDAVFLHQHYKMNEFGTILGPKDPEW